MQRGWTLGWFGGFVGFKIWEVVDGARPPLFTLPPILQPIGSVIESSLPTVHVPISLRSQLNTNKGTHAPKQFFRMCER